MKYHAYYFWLFKRSIKQVLRENYDESYAKEILKKSKQCYRTLVEEMDDIGHDNPMAYNALFALVFVAPYIASEKRIPPEMIQEMMRRSLYSIRWYFARTDLNTKRGKASNKKVILRYLDWYTPEREKKYPTSFKVDLEGQPYEEACYYRITRCPICAYAERLGVDELMPLFCELDDLMISLEHGVLHRKETIASGGDCCDYLILGDKESRAQEDK
ncbi:L-2-amino-thiazoline-4-carboxylic acid hydrolase [Kallipyga massiliensis]|uniref:L-2-amino-thiazoline-4-carboxylic acid hydrolase n=1 Tax=Kallipyga massiliensis TaxID=1472764 RepID=UPI0026EA0C25|nr:L-2-amino-thiazoline-4-carboxylic acid hydrolase [Kallipyga massiliensis]